MTTTVKIEAHLSTDKVVEVRVLDNGTLIELFRLEDGETAERVVHDTLDVRVCEVRKTR